MNQVAVVTDCRDSNAEARIRIRLHELFPGAGVTFMGVDRDLTGGGGLVDSLDAMRGGEGIVIANAAPRSRIGGPPRKNGSPFGFFWAGKALVVATVDGYMLSFARKLGLVEATNVRVLDVREVLQAQAEAGLFDPHDIERVARSQFRSYEFAPLAALWLTQGHDLPSAPFQNHIQVLPHNRVWLVDGFGNVKITALPEEIGWEEGADLHTNQGPVSCCHDLVDVPAGQAGIVIGSSGFGPNRFVELVIGGEGNAAKEFELDVGDEIF